MHRSLRHASILNALRAHGACTVAELARDLNVSQETIRRDIKTMARQGLVERVHGGATMNDVMHEPAFQKRLATNAEAKRAISAVVAARIRSGDTVMLDTGSTTVYVARALVHHRDLTVVTNCVHIASTLANNKSNRVFLVGGELRPDDGALLGAAALAFLERFRAQHAVLSIGAMDLEDGLMDYHPHEADFAQAVMRRANSIVVAADCSKFGRHAPVRVCGFADIDVLVCDRPPPDAFIERLKSAEVTLKIAEPRSAA
jgi:DeoR family glycerol-3-phosphate regulon repressor